MNYKLSPSDLTFLYDQCKYCFVLKVKYGISQPSIPIPAVFTKIANLQKDYYSGKRTEEFCPELPPGVVTHGEKWIRSENIVISGCQSTCYINGRFDIVTELDDRTFAVLDFKTGSPSEGKSEMYGRQLHAYAIALENPAEGYIKLSPVSKLGLLYFTPEKYGQSGKYRQILEGPLQLVEIERDDPAFIGFIEEVVKLLDGPAPEPQPDTCNWCSYLTKERPSDQDPQKKNKAGHEPECPLCNSPMRLKTGKYGEFWSCVKFPDCRGTKKHIT